jgi:predicted amidophosphoribosyltransferase
LQKELARVLAEVDRLKNGALPPVAAVPVKATPAPAGLVCPSCGAKFTQELKFCGECGKPMKVAL